MDGIGSFGLPGGLSALPSQCDPSSNDTSRRRKANKSANATATSASRSRSNKSSSVNPPSACYPLFRSLPRKGDETKSSGKKSGENEEEDLSIQESDVDDDDMPLASLADTKGSRRKAGTGGMHVGDINAENQRRDTGGTKRRKLVETSSTCSDASVASTAAARHADQDGGHAKRGRKEQQQRRQSGIGEFLSSSSSQEAMSKSSIGTSASASAWLGTSIASSTNTTANRTSAETNADNSEDAPGNLGNNGSTTSVSDGDDLGEKEYLDAKEYRNAMQFGMRHCAIPRGASSSGIGGKDAGNVNVLSDLFRRSIFPIAHRRGSSALPKPRHLGPTDALRRFANAPDKWTKCETVRIPTHSTVAFEFDRLGVLFATADARGTIAVYDFDELCAADIAARRVACRAQTAPGAIQTNNLNGRQSSSICPILAFSIRSASRISCIKWDPNCQDLLVVSFATDCRIRIYDLNSGSEAEGPKHIVLSDADSLRGHLRTEGNLSIHHLPPTSRKISSLLAGGANGTLRLWNFPRSLSARGNKKIQMPTLVWSISPFSSSSHLSADNEGISSICYLENCNGSSRNLSGKGSDLVLVGGTKGSLAIIDLFKLSKKAFSTKLTPTIVWSSNIVRHITRRRLVEEVLPSNSWMGIKKISLCDGVSADGSRKTSPTSSRSFPFEEACISLVTNCGWALNASIRGLGRAGRISPNHPAPAESSVIFSLEIAFKTATTMWLNSDLEEIFVGEKALTFSLPPAPTPVCTLPGQSSLLAIASVKRNIKVMSNKDKRVLSSLPDAEIERLSKDDGDAILLVDLDSAPSESRSVVSRIPIDNGVPNVLAVHPGGQWMVVGYCAGEGSQAELTLLCQRSKP